MEDTGSTLRREGGEGSNHVAQHRLAVAVAKSESCHALSQSFLKLDCPRFFASSQQRRFRPTHRSDSRLKRADARTSAQIRDRSRTATSDAHSAIRNGRHREHPSARGWSGQQSCRAASPSRCCCEVGKLPRFESEFSETRLSAFLALRFLSLSAFLRGPRFFADCPRFLSAFLRGVF